MYLIKYSGDKKVLVSQVLLLRMITEVCNFHHRYTLTKNPGNHIVGFLKNLFVNYGGK